MTDRMRSTPLLFSALVLVWQRGVRLEAPALPYTEEAAVSSMEPLEVPSSSWPRLGLRVCVRV